MKGLCVFVVVVMAMAAVVKGSSHSEAPGVSKMPQADNSDFYMFRSYESGRSAYTTFVMNVQGLQNPFAGPNYYSLSDDHFYQIKIDNTGDAVEDITIQFYAGNRLGGEAYTVPASADGPEDCIIGDIPAGLNETKHKGLFVPIEDSDGKRVRDQYVPLKFIGPIGVDKISNVQTVNWYEWYQINWITKAGSKPVYKNGTRNGIFEKPFDYAGEKTFGTPAQYEEYARTYIFGIDIPGCPVQGKVFVGQRLDGFSVNLGEIFDLVNFLPLEGYIAQEDCNNNLRYSNVDSFIIEVPTQCIVGTSDVIGAWTTVNRLCHDGADHVVGDQVSRLGNPLVNEVVIPIAKKSAFNQAVPTGDAQFLDYVQYPSFPAIMDALFRSTINSVYHQIYKNIAPSNFPRDDLVAVFLTGVDGINKPAGVTPSEQLRLNTSFPALSASQQNNLGVIAGDNSGFPNGRRPGDDVIDIVLRVAMGKLCNLGLYCNNYQAPAGGYLFTDGAPVNATYFDNYFPYFRTPVSGSPYPGELCGSAVSVSGGAVFGLFGSLLLLFALFF